MKCFATIRFHNFSLVVVANQIPSSSATSGNSLKQESRDQAMVDLTEESSEELKSKIEAMEKNLKVGAAENNVGCELSSSSFHLFKSTLGILLPLHALRRLENSSSARNA